MVAPALNPVERRIAELGLRWQAFRARPEARLLLWQLPESGLRMAECFVEAQKLELPYVTGDVFLLFKQPFVHPLQYTRALKEALRGIVDASAQDFAAQGLEPWRFDPAATPDTPAWFAEAVRGFASRHHRAMAPEAQVVVVLWPGAVAHLPGWLRWVRALLDVGLPPRLRVLVADTLETPRFGALAGDPRVAAERVDIDGLALAQETFAQEGGVGPAAVFRQLMMGVVALIDKGSPEQVKAKAADALQFARAQGWADQQVALRVMVAGALLKAGRHGDALVVYRAARQAADETVAAGHPAGRKLVLQVLFGAAAVHLAAGDAAAAAADYDEAALFAQHDTHPLLALEAFRMAAFCLGRGGDRDGAEQRCDCAVEIGAAMKPEARPLTTLAVALADAMRRLDPARVREMQAVKGRLARQLDAVRERGDALAARLVERGAPDALEQVDAQRSREAEAAAADAVARLEALGADAAPAFARRMATGRELLGPAWLVDSDLALPAPPQEHAR